MKKTSNVCNTLEYKRLRAVARRIIKNAKKTNQNKTTKQLEEILLNTATGDSSKASVVNCTKNVRTF